MSTMVEILQRIIDTKGDGYTYGLCKELNLAEDYDPDVLESLFETWEHFSGCEIYPVPDPEKPNDPRAAGEIYETDCWSGEYGQLRLDLARHLLRELSK